MAARKKTAAISKKAAIATVSKSKSPKGGVRKKMGRPMDFTPALGAELCRLVEEIGYLTIAAESLGISRRTAFYWQQWGLEGDLRFVTFARDLAVARARWSITLLKRVEDPKWLLEKAEPSIFGPKAEPPVQVHVQATLTREAALTRLAELAQDDPQVAQALRLHADEQGA